MLVAAAIPPPPTPPLGLSPQQYRMALMVMEGVGNREIAAALCVELQTVKNCLERAFKKLGVNNRTELALKLWWELEGKDKG